MRVIAVVILSLFALVGCNIMPEIGRSQIEEAQSGYEIDLLNTKNAPWQVGERTVENLPCYHTEGECYTLFFGITKNATALTQDFYMSGEKASDLYEVSPIDLLESSIEERVATQMGVDGVHTSYYKNGNRAIERETPKGQLHGRHTRWYENGQMMFQGSWQNWEQVGIWREWDEQGNLINEKDMDAPENNEPAGKQMRR